MKHSFKISKFIIVATILLLIFSSSIVAFHGFSHQKNIEQEHCLLCVAANFQNQIFLASDLPLAIAAFYLIFLLRYFDFTKPQNHLFLRASRAPPCIF